ncbi:DUF5947 family protein [Streptomyces sp. C10-9-1]|uniref:DUF5947 family protein n=1 Tax=Streptomyces sp. C10-9-1 TaxID=1859285 RepID=UPI002111EFB1|nr:DUF5947 family protein [Streptomyces sp. C10-9-1]MCQ6553273.1 DUF5947 family protein [Streptomyces sp. C10-9-1]
MTAPHPLRAAAGAAARQPRGLRRFTAPRPPAPETCELCGGAVPEDHRHLVDTDRRSLACACADCALLMDRPGAAGGRFRAVPDRRLSDPGHGFDDGLWDRLGIPVGMVFFFRNTALDRLVALYPSPAGATEHQLEPEGERAVLDATRLAGELAPDTEAVLVRRTDGHTECHLVPVDLAYELTGRMRMLWRGFDGGAEARAAVDGLFAEVRRTARTLGAPRP